MFEVYIDVEFIKFEKFAMLALGGHLGRSTLSFS